MLSKLRERCFTISRITLPQYFATVLVLGLCFFAGGMRFSEQGFDASKALGFLSWQITYEPSLFISCNASAFFPP
jgi:hypothetical protein